MDLRLLLLWPAVADSDPGSAVPPFSESLDYAPRFVLGVLDLLSKRYGRRNETVAPNERRSSGFSSGTASSDLEGVNTGGAVRFGIPKLNGFYTALGWEALALDPSDATSLVSKVLCLRPHLCVY